MKNILLTGDSKGLGKSIKNQLREKGYNVIGISRTSEDIKFDFSKSEDIKSLYFDEIKNRGPIHGFINNAALAYDDIITYLNFESLEKMYRINVFSPMMLTKYILRDFLLNKVSGSIVHISSVSAHTGYKGLAMYASTKGSLEAFSKNTAREWGRLGVRSNIICPGFMKTNMSSSISDEIAEKIFKRNSKLSLLNVVDVANACVFLISNESNGITGEILHVDNGTI